jgi:hypothetical protein
MDKPQIDMITGYGPSSIQLDLTELDLSRLASLDGTALHAIIQELNEDSNEGGQSKHHSHSSYSTHGTAAW